MTNVAKVYLTLHSVNSLSTANTYNDIENIARSLNDSLDVYKRSSNVDINCSNDFFEYGNIGESLDDKLYDIAQNNWDYYQLALNEMSSVVLPYVTNNNTEGMIAVINNQTVTLPRHYSFILTETYNWPTVAPEQHTTSWSHTLSMNSKFIADNHNDSDDFISLSKENYENLDFHPDLENTITTVLHGTYSDYKYLFSHSMNTLNQAFHEISTNPNQNESDLDKIKEVSAQLGKTLSCTRQRKNKVEWDFQHPINSDESETINCEYHLKINWTDAGVGLPRKKKVRVYFGLKSYDEFERKQFKLAHMGKHL
ncbi:hypothetical protein [Vibrio crassostreae]|uniref:hypothetical protein n=1 Tax=Vibrio crassostreae TaxID=246167 RepID=UPI00114D9D2B|nr:hypothetical protein [Vibrio crassostreae]TQK25521.1 hypothetical protein FB441_3728 [Vibrio crassostreae]CAK2514611.1 conserved hypothetical protein [Vibrio crassostreae]CAK3651594.1 conserved hypothetical protein [Vibrio crassostreae]